MSVFGKKTTEKMFDFGNMVSVIGPEAYFKGTVTAKGSIRVDGKMDGSITEAAAVIVGESGMVGGDISCENATIGGEVKGNIAAARSVELLSSARVTGDIRTAKILIEEGAYFNGRCTMTQAENLSERLGDAVAGEN